MPVLGRRPLGVGALGGAAAFAPDRRVLVVLGLPYQHGAGVGERLAASHPGALVAEADTERAAVAAPARRGGGGDGGGVGGGDGGDADGAAAASVARSLADGRLLGRRLPTALDAELGECALLYAADDDPTLANLASFARTEVHVAPPPPTPTRPPAAMATAAVASPDGRRRSG